MDNLRSIEELICPLSGETQHEELWNYRTHLFGFFCSIIGFIYLITHSLHLVDTTLLWGLLLYGLSQNFVYLSSLIYHKQTNLYKKRMFRLIDHICIYFGLAGIYSPFLLGPFYQFFGLEMFILLWVLSGLCCFLKMRYFDKFLKFSLVSYSTLFIVFFVYWIFLQNMLTPECVKFGILSALFACSGVGFFLWESLPYNHAIWHIHVLASSATNFLSILHIGSIP